MNGSEEQAVLVVDDDVETRGAVAAWLSEQGYTVLTCPGPQHPSYTCLGGRGDRCPLANAVDVVVLDMRLLPDEVMAGSPGWQLLLYYLERGKQVVAISGDSDAVRARPDDHVEVITRPARREALLRAVRKMFLRTTIDGARAPGTA